MSHTKVRLADAVTQLKSMEEGLGDLLVREGRTDTARLIAIAKTNLETARLYCIEAVEVLAAGE